MPRIRLLLLDDHILFREGLGRLLASEPDFEMLAECGTPKEALESLSRLPVDVVLLDFDLEDDTGSRFIAAARNAGYKGKILMVTAGMSPLDISVTQQLGISGIFLKHNPPRLLLEAIRAVASGSEWMDPRLTPAATTGAKKDAHLSPREQQVLRYVFEGLSNKEMAYQLGVSQSSIKATLQHLFDKMGVRTRGQLVRIAIERSLEDARRA